MKKLLIFFIIVCLGTTTGFAQKGMFKKKDKKAAKEQVDDVEEKIKEETKKLKAKTEEDAKPVAKEKSKPAKEKVAAPDAEMSPEAMRKMADINEEMKQKIAVEEGEATMSAGLHNGYTVFIKGGSVNKVEKHWKKYLKSAFSGKTDTDKNGEILSEKVSIPSVGDAVSIFARVKEVSNGAEITTFFDAGIEDGYLNSASNSEGVELISKIMQEFGVQERVYAIEQQIEDEEKALKRLNKDLKNLEDDNGKYHKTIEKAKLDIVENEKDQELKNMEITEQIDIINAIKEMKDGVE